MAVKPDVRGAPSSSAETSGRTGAEAGASATSAIASWTHAAREANLL